MTKSWCFSFILYVCTSVCAGMSARTQAHTDVCGCQRLTWAAFQHSPPQL